MGSEYTLPRKLNVGVYTKDQCKLSNSQGDLDLDTSEKVKIKGKDS